MMRLGHEAVSLLRVSVGSFFARPNDALDFLGTSAGKCLTFCKEPAKEGSGLTGKEKDHVCDPYVFGMFRKHGTETMNFLKRLRKLTN